MLAANTRDARNDNRVNRTRDYGVSLLLPNYENLPNTKNIILPVKSEKKPEMIKLPDLSDLADLGTDFLGGIFGVSTALL